MSVECGLPNEFCFMDLRKGVKVIGYITGVLSLIFSIQLLVYLFSDFNEIKNEISDKNEEVIEKLDGTQGPTQAVAGVLLAIFILYFIASVFVVKGSASKSRSQLSPFLLTTSIIIVLSLVIAIIQYNEGPFFAVLLFALVLIYFLMCVMSLYKKLSIEN